MTRLMLHHTEWIEGMAEVMGNKCIGNDELAKEQFKALIQRFGRHEFEMERYCDHMLLSGTYNAKVNAPAQPE